MAKKKTTQTKIESIRHKDRRMNIPTEELRDFVADDERKPKAMLYPRDPSLDPQLVWKGKDAQDAEDLSVPVVPIYIQEKIHPQAIIDALPRLEKAGDSQIDLFSDFNGGPQEFEKKVEFYHHDQNWTNRLILGDSLLVMASLAEKEGLRGKIQTIYIDPPYGIKFGSNWQVSTRKREVKDGKAEDITRQPEQVRAFRDTWKLGVHSYLAYLRDRLVIARDLLTETGSLFVQIGDENQHLVRSVLDEVFGSDNFIATITLTKTTSATSELLAGVADFILLFAKNRDQMKYRQIYVEKELGGAGTSGYSWIELADGKRQKLNEDIAQLETGRVFTVGDLTSQRPLQGSDVSSFSFEGRVYSPGKGTFKTDQAGLETLALARRLQAVGSTLRYVRFIDDFAVYPLANVWTDTGIAGYASHKQYVVETSVKIVERCLLMTTDPGDLVLDPTCGSGTTAYVAELWGRRWITCDTSRVALALARTRMMSARYPYYLLVDSPEGIKKESEHTGKIPPEFKTESDIRKGFVYKRVPHVTLKSIANNPDIKEGMTREQINAAIARHAGSEMLYDQPFVNAGRKVRHPPWRSKSAAPLAAGRK